MSAITLIVMMMMWRGTLAKYDCASKQDGEWRCGYRAACGAPRAAQHGVTVCPLDFLAPG